MSDFDILRNLNQQDAPGGLAQEEVVQMLAALQQQVGTQQQQIESMRDLGARKGVESKAAEVPPPVGSVKFNSDGTVDISKLTQEQFQYFNQASDFYKQALGGFAQEANQIRAQEERARSQPWQQLATALSANLAQAKDMPGWVQALGRTSAQLNPTVDQLQARRLAVLGQGAQIAEKGMALGIAQERTLEDRAMRQESEAVRRETQRQRLVKEEYDNAAEAIKAGPGMINGKAIAAALVKAGATKDEVGVLLDQLENLSANVGTKFLLERADRETAQKLAQAQENRRTRLAEEGLQLEKRRADISEERMRMAEFTSEKADYTRNTSLQVGEQQAVLTAFNALNIVGKMDDLAKSKKVTPGIGPIAGRVQYLNPYRSGEWQQITNFADQLLLSGLSGKLGAGVSDRDVQLMRSVMPNGKMTQEQFDATTKVMRAINPDNVARLMQANPNVQYWKSLKPQFEKAGMGKLYAEEMNRMLTTNAQNYPNLFGPDRPPIAERTFGPDTKVSTESPDVSGGPSFDEYLKWKASKGVK